MLAVVFYNRRVDRVLPAEDTVLIFDVTIKMSNP
jgi:hypothetical protein